MEKVRCVGLDVHAETIAVAVAEPGGEVRALGMIPEPAGGGAEADEEARARRGRLRVCYEAGPTGYVLYWQLTELGVPCEVVAPTLVPVKPGDRVKTDRRDAMKLARSYRAGDLTPVWVPDAAHEALRDLVRAREAAKQDQLRARHRLGKFLLRHGRRPAGAAGALDAPASGVDHAPGALRAGSPGGDAAGLSRTRSSTPPSGWRGSSGRSTRRLARRPPRMRAVIDALQALRGIAKVSAVTVVAEVGELSRFARARQLMGYSGLGAREHSSGARCRRGGITKTGNAHLRRIVVEAAWAYRHRPVVGKALRARQAALSPAVRELAWKAQHRLHGRYRRLLGRGKCQQQVVTAVGRELLGFMWAIGRTVEGAWPQGQGQAA